MLAGKIFVLNPDSEVGESCLSSCSCSICWAATKGEHDPPAIILFRRYDGRISRILEHEHDDEHEHDSPN
jgi:hypothetical protein